jgi:hypothetical protein
MTPRFRAQSHDWQILGIMEELHALERENDGRSLHLFLMLNDQRRHLARHFENIDINRFEFQLPFYDSDFLSIILRAPVRPFLRHKLYHKWLINKEPLAASVPWQTYPNHEPCPIPYPSQLGYQWNSADSETADDRKLTRRLGRSAARQLLMPNFPSHLIDRLGFGGAILCCLAGASTYSHVASVGETFARYWNLSQPSE